MRLFFRTTACNLPIKQEQLTMSHDYALDTNAAKQADNFFSRIESKGKYTGIFTRAEKVTSAKGSRGVDFSFKSDDGATADYLTLWTHNAEGKQLYSYNTLMAIMTCLRVKELTAESGEVEKYDPNQKQRVKETVPLFKTLMNRPIGLLMHMEEYDKKSGGTGWKPSISAPFDEAGFTASEILTKAKTPENVEKMFAALRDRPLKQAKASANNAPASSAGYAQQSGGVFDDFEDDLPF
jgi:hypothetical protein